MGIYPFSLKETYDYLNYQCNKLNKKQVMELYMALGGIPHYLEKIKADLSAAQNIERLFFSRDGLLFQEFDKLFLSLFSHSTAYIELIKLIAEKRKGIPRKEFEHKAKLSETGGTLTERLTALEQTGFIKSFIPVGYSEKGLCYKLIDEYCLFYLTWVHPIKRQIEHESDAGYWMSKSNTPAWYSWSGYAFEALCLKHIRVLKKALFIPAAALSGSWRSESAQIDLLFDRDDDVITLCEIKYCQEPFEIDSKYAAELEKKELIFKAHYKTNKQIFLSMITANGLKKNK
jgi:uncharacterized protein